MFMAYFPANTTYESILADIYAGAVSNPGVRCLQFSLHLGPAH